MASIDPAGRPGDRAAGVLVVCHAGASTGLGHLSRMLALIAALRTRGVTDLRMLVIGEEIKLSGLEAVPHRIAAPDAHLADDVLLEIDAVSPSVVVFDLYPGRVEDGLNSMLKILAERGIRLVGVDSLRSSCSVLDLVWIPSFHVAPSELLACPGKLKFGWDTFLIRKRITDRKWRPGNRVLALTGGSDATGQGATLPGLLDRSLSAGTEVHWVRGPFSPAPLLPPSSRLKWLVHDAPNGLDELIVASDYVITVFGVSFFEAANYGIPTVVFSPYGEKDSVELGALRAERMCEVAANGEAAVERLVTLMADPETAACYSTSCKRLLAVDGAGNLAEHIHSLIDR